MVRCFTLVHRLHSDQKAIAAIEFAFVVPSLIFVLLGIVQFGITINNYEMLTGGAAMAARQFALSRGSSTPYSNTTTALYSAVPNLTQAKINVTLKVNGTACASNASCQTAMTSGQGKPATVIASYPCNLSFAGFNFAPSCTLSSTITESIE